MSVECKLCNSPLGTEWEDKLPYCVQCRFCLKCGGIVSAPELKQCDRNGWDILHARCRVTSNGGVKLTIQSEELELLNLCRLTIFPDLELSHETNVQCAAIGHGQLVARMTTEEKFLFMDMLEAVYTRTFLALKGDVNVYKAEAEERERKKFEKVKEEVRINNRTKSEKKLISAQDKHWAMFKSMGIAEDEAKRVWETAHPGSPWEVKQ